MEIYLMLQQNLTKALIYQMSWAKYQKVHTGTVDKGYPHGKQPIVMQLREGVSITEKKYRFYMYFSPDDYSYHFS